MGTAAVWGNPGIYFSAQWRPNNPADAGEALVGQIATPLANGASPIWIRQWPDGDGPYSVSGCLNAPVIGNGYDTLLAAAVGPDGVYFGGASYYQTADGIGCKEDKEIVAKFNLNGSAGGADVAGAAGLWRQRFGTTYGYDGSEGFEALVTSVEDGTTYVYGAGFTQLGSNQNGHAIRKYDTSGNQVWQYAEVASWTDYRALAVLGSYVYAAGNSGYPGVPQIAKFPIGGAAPAATFQVPIDSGFSNGIYNAITVLNGTLYAAGRLDVAGENASYVLDAWDPSGTRLFHRVWSSDQTKSNNQQLTGITAVGSRLFAVGWTRDTDNTATAHNMGGPTTPVFPDSASYHGYADGVIFEINPSDGSLISTTSYGTGDGYDEAFTGATTDGGDLYVVGGERDASGFYHAIVQRYSLMSPSTLTVASATGQYGGRASLQANVSSWGVAVTGATVDFTLGGNPVGSAQTDGTGTATLANVPLTGMPAGPYPGAIGASFAGSGYQPSSGSNNLTVTQAPATIAVAGAGSFVYDGQPHAATALVTGVLGEPLGSATITYTNLSTNVTHWSAPVTVGSYRINASYAGNANYLAGANGSLTITIDLDPRASDVAVDVGGNTIKKLKGADGTVLWSASVTNEGALAVDPIDFGVYTGHGSFSFGSPGSVYKYSATGAPSWRSSISGGGFCNFYYVSYAAVDATSGNPGVVWTQTGCYGGIAKSDRSTGAQQWAVFTNDIGRASIDPATGQIYAITNAGADYAYNTLYSATAIGSLASASSCQGLTDVTAADGMLYRGGGACGLALSQMNKASLGSVNWTMSLAGAIGSFDALAADPRSGGYLYAASTASWKIAVIDPASRAVVRTFPTAVQPNSIAVDPRNGNVYVASSSNHFVFAYTPTGTLVWTSPDLGGPVTALAAPRNPVGLAGVPLAATTTNVAASANPSVVGQAVTFTATVAGTGGTPTGTVQFKDNGTPIGGPVALTTGTATVTTSSLTVGSHAVSAEYSGDSSFDGSGGTLTQTVVQNHPPSITSTGGPYVIDLGENLVLNGTATDSDIAAGDTLTYAWDVNGDAVADYTGASGATTVPWTALKALFGIDENTLTTTQRTMRFTVTDGSGASASSTATITIYPNVVVPSLSIGTAACSQATSFDASASRNLDPRHSIVTYTFSFGDGSVYTEIAGSASDGSFDGRTTHVYTHAGTYTATATATDDQGKTASQSAQANITIQNHAPVAKAGGPYAIDIGSGLTLDGSGSSDADQACGDSIAQYAWDLNNDGVYDVTSTSPSMSVTPEELGALGLNVAGSSTITVRVTDSLGASGTASTSLTRYDNRPTASFSAAPSPASCGAPTSFDGSASHAGRPDRAIVDYAWEFGDGSTSAGPASHVSHTYLSFGNYNARLTVTDNNVPPKTATATQIISVSQGNVPPIANAGGPYNVDFGGAVQLNGANSSDANASCGDSIVSYVWTIDGSLQLSGASPTLNTAVNSLGIGSHTVLLTVTDGFGATGTASTTLNVRRVLVSIAVTPPTFNSHQPYGGQQFTATGTFNDGTTQVLQSAGGGTGGGSGPPTSTSWLVVFPHYANFSACSTPQYPLDPSSSNWISQGFVENGGAVHTTWSPGTPVVQVDGTVNASDVVLSLSCTNGAAAGTIDAHWTGTGYEGSLSFNGSTTDVRIIGWAHQAPMPTARFGLGAGSAGGKIYAIGGVAGTCGATSPCNFGPLPTVESYDPTTGTWSTAPSLNIPREGAGVTALGGAIYVAGGHVPGGSASGVVEAFDPAASSAWTVLPDAESMPTPRAHFALVTDGTYLYALGGDTTSGNGGPVATVERYDPSAHSWSTLAPMPAAGNFIAAAVLNGSVVVVNSDGTSRTDVYDIATNTWHTGAPMPAPRTAAGVAVANGGLWVIGGMANGSLAYDTWVYYPATNNQPDGWALIAPMPTGRVELAAAVVGDVVYAIGGSDSTPGAGSALAANDSLSTPPPGVVVPSAGSGGSGGGSGSPIVQWQSTNPSAAVVDSSGFVNLQAFGSTTIVASAGDVSCETSGGCATVTVSNSAPTVQIVGRLNGPPPLPEYQSGPFAISEGGPSVQLFADAHDPDNDSLTYTWSILEGAQGSGGGTGGMSGTTINYAAADGQAATTIQVVVTDSFGASATATTTISVANVAPQVFVPPSAFTQAGSTGRWGCASFFDPGSADAPWTATVDYGDGTGEQAVTVSVPGGCGGGTTTGAFDLSHAYASGGTYTVTVRVTDKDHATGTATVQVTVNAPPAVTIASPLGPVDEGSPLNGSGSFTDVSTDGPWTVRVTYGDNTGQFTLPQADAPGSFAFSHVYKDNGTYTVTVHVTDKFYATGSTTMAVTVNNVAPSVSVPASIGPISESSSTNLMNVTGSFSDPGINDGQAAGFSGTVDYGDGTPLQNLSLSNIQNGHGNFSLSHRYGDNPAAPATSYTVTVSVRDKDGAVSTGTFHVTVTNVPPTAQLDGSSSVVEGVAKVFTGLLLDPGANDAPWTGTVDYGDGTLPQTLAFTPGAPSNAPQNTRGTFALTHTYAHYGSYTMTLTATDKDGGIGQTTFPIHVRPALASLVIAPSSATANAAGGTVPFNATATFSDGTALSTEGQTIDGVSWSSSNSNAATIGPGGLATAVAPGVTTISVAVTDEAGIIHTAQAILTVDFTPPVIVANDVRAEATSSAGAAVVFAVSATDDFDSHPTVSADHPSGATYPIGITVVTVTATDAAGNSTTKIFHVNVVDTTPPTMTLPADVTVDATSPSGAVVTYGASAIDLVSGAVAVICTPASGSTFPIGTTTVGCTATDGAGNRVSGTFHVIVRSAADQIARLIATIQTFALGQGVGNSFTTKLQNALAALAAGGDGGAAAGCNQLTAFINETTAQAGKKLAAGQANQMIADALRIKGVLGCR